MQLCDTTSLLLHRYVMGCKPKRYNKCTAQTSRNNELSRHTFDALTSEEQLKDITVTVEVREATLTEFMKLNIFFQVMNCIQIKLYPQNS